jgi:hypothetical protein
VLLHVPTCSRHYPGGPLGSDRSWTAYSSLAIHPQRRRPSPLSCRVGVHIGRFEACSTFTRVTACRLAASPKRHIFLEGFDTFVTSTAAPIATGWSDPVTGWELHPLKNSTWHGAQPSQTREANLVRPREANPSLGSLEQIAAERVVALVAHPTSPVRSNDQVLGNPGTLASVAPLASCRTTAPFWPPSGRGVRRYARTRLPADLHLRPGTGGVVYRLAGSGRGTPEKSEGWNT